MAMITILCLIWAIIIEKKIFQSSNPLYPRDLHELSKPHNEVSNFKKKKKLWPAWYACSWIFLRLEQHKSSSGFGVGCIFLSVLNNSWHLAHGCYFLVVKFSPVAAWNSILVLYWPKVLYPRINATMFKGRGYNWIGLFPSRECMHISLLFVLRQQR